MAVRQFLRTNWRGVTIGVTALVIFCGVIPLLSTMPPRTIAMATGPEGSGYEEVGRQYQSALERAGVQVRLVATAGSLENLALLRDPRSGVNVALVQGGSISAHEAPELESLGTLFYEPLWIFHRTDLQVLTTDDLRGLKVSIGPLGSGTRMLSLELLKRNGLDQQVSGLLALTPQAAADKLLAAEIDAAFILASWDAPAVQRLVADERVGLTNVPRADAYVALYPFLSKVTVPAGVGDLGKHLPPSDVTLVCDQGQPGGAQGSALRDPIPTPEYRRAAPFGSRNVPSRRPFSGSGRHRSSLERPSHPVLQIWTTFLAEQSSVLDGFVGRSAARSAHSDRRSAVPHGATAAGALQLAHAVEDRATLR